MTLKKTPLHGRHQALEARLVDFAGFEMPVLYNGILEEHAAVRNGVGVFDVSHMGEMTVSGPQALEFLEYLAPNNVSRLDTHQVLYTCMCYPDGGTVDDLLIYKMRDHYLLVINAGNTDKDVEWIQQQAANFDVEAKNVSAEFSQLALQGPRADEVLSNIVDADLASLKYFWSSETEVFGEKVLISRTGYTGENGFEIYGSPEFGVKLWDAFMELGVAPIGLGARDSLRFEACLSLYGHELEKDISPIEAGLGWTVKDKPNNYIAKEILLEQKQNPPRHLIGLKMLDPGVARQGYPVIHNGEEIGFITSGMKAPALDSFLALALVNQDVEVGDKIQVEIRGAQKQMECIKMPFYKRS